MKILIKKCFSMSQSSLRDHSLKLNKKKVRLDVAKFFFSNKVVNKWNILDEEIISGCSLAGFKRKLETVSIAEPLQNRQHVPLMLSTLGSKEKREGGRLR